MSTLFITLMVISVGWGIASFMVVTSYLSSRGVKINYLFLRVLMFKYVNEYHRLTKEERGRPGLWHYSFVISMCLTFVFAVLGLTLRGR